ncbi:MAG: hypothetical protein JW932_12240 [Deltaproteobacteria bacterium]|nr:hypothetical protein [Deltaproteobacteria bacterium]
MSDQRHFYRSIGEIRDNTLLLLLANQYICEEHYLVKIGNALDQNAKQLKKDIIALKDEFPGRFVSDVNTDDIVDHIIAKAQMMQKPGKDVQQKCVTGALGHELEEDIKSISQAIGRIERKVEGRDVSYTAKDSMSSLFSGVTSLGAFIGKFISISVKILVFMVVIGAGITGYLYFTMEKISDVEKEMLKRETILQSQRAALSQLEARLAQFIERKKSLEKKELDLKEKIEFMNLDVDIHKTNEEQQQITAEMENTQAEITAYQKKIEDMEKKSFLMRLYRQ